MFKKVIVPATTVAVLLLSSCTHIIENKEIIYANQNERVSIFNDTDRA